MARSPEWEAAYRKLDEAAHDLYRLLELDTDEPGDPKGIPTDYVLVVGCMFIDDDNDRCGVTSVFPKHGAQPVYITSGLLTIAQNYLTR